MDVIVQITNWPTRHYIYMYAKLLTELFTLDDNIKGTIEAILANLLNFGVRGTPVSIFV